ncbi:MAG TPA: aspartyl/asparaginyl beta-hydroxylase domain-containing protein [Microthrixaceae bacterium]|nr:aspartyl/asparaginyl beta-hydroxylase domain-containing protein [Microthrixaceae bacterium]
MSLDKDTTGAAPLPRRLDMPIDFDPLLEDLHRLAGLGWRRQATARTDQVIAPREDDDWSVVPLVAPLGDMSRTDPGLLGEEYSETPVLAELPALRELLRRVPGERMATRLMRLRPHAQVDEHVDPYFGLSYGKVRLHVPLITNPDALMWFGQQSEHWSAGHLWYGDFSTPHRVSNEGRQDRIHLVLDTVLTPELLDLFVPEQRAVALLSRPLRASAHDALSAPLPTGRWEMTAPASAFDYSGTADADEETTLDLSVTESDVRLRLPNGVAARLRQVGPREYRVGRMPEEITVVLSPGLGKVVRRGSRRVEYAVHLSRR